MALVAEASFRILHVDDDPALIDVTADFLATEDDRFTVEAATSAAEGLDRLDDGDIDCVISDYEMPGMDGIEFLEAVREEWPDLPFILFTGKGSEAVASEAISAGVTDYLQKGTGTEQYTLLANRVRNAVESHAAEREARLARDRVETLLSRPADFIYALAEDGTVASVTPAVERVLGTDAADVAGTNAFEAVHPDDRESVFDAFERVVEDADTDPGVSARLEHDDGSWRSVRVVFRNCLDDPAVGAVLANVRDVTERETCLQELDRYRTLVQTAGDAMYALDEEGYIEMVNASHVEWSGYTESELVGTHVSEFMPADAVEEGIELTLELLRNPDKHRARFEFPATRPDGEERIYEDNLAVLTDTDGNYSGSIGVIRDITEQKRRERALERQNERLDNFASIISHDIRNPLQVASGNLAQARETGDEAAFEKVARAHDRIDAIIDDVLTLARHGQSVAETEPTLINSVARDAWATVDTREMALELSGDQRLEAEPDRLRQLFENLFRNAVEHAGPDVTVTVGPIEPFHTATRVANDAGSGFYVADDGPGIPEAERGDVLDFGVSGSSGGTGFGLAIVSQIADAHGWETTVTESASGGARFEFVEAAVSDLA
jgi:PAS domain S-box-containing protein